MQYKVMESDMVVGCGLTWQSQCVERVCQSRSNSEIKVSPDKKNPVIVKLAG